MKVVVKLLDEIIDLAIDQSADVAGFLRKCLVLAYQLKNDSLKSWIGSELEGYAPDDL